MALQAQAVIVGWHIYELSKDPLMLGLIGLAEAIPAIGFAFLAGHVVDNRRPVSVYRAAVLTLVFNSLLLCVTTSERMPLSNSLRIELLFLSVFISGMVRSFTSPSVFALTSHVVPRPLLSEAAAWNGSTFQLAAIFGPSIGGLLYGKLGVTAAFGLPAVLMCCALFTLTLFSTKASQYKSPSRREPFLSSILEGIRFTLGQKVLLSSMTLDMFSVLFGGAVAVLPMFSDQVLHAGSFGLGLLRAAPSVGSGVVALTLAFKPMKTISGRTLLIVIAGFGFSTVAFAVSKEFSLAFFFLMASGAFDGVSVVIRNTILQLLTPENMRGRVSSMSMIFITSSNEIGAFESGLAAKLMGLVPSIIFGGTMTMGIVGLTAWFSPQLAATRIQPGE